MSDRGSLSVLFACMSNCVRSPIAAALARHHLGSKTQIESAHIDPRERVPFAVAVMAGRGLDITALSDLTVARDLRLSRDQILKAYEPIGTKSKRGFRRGSRRGPVENPLTPLDFQRNPPHLLARSAASRAIDDERRSPGISGHGN
ncbi:MAG: hypothetical protein U1E87_00855 [Alphaproteobacteria bacterium]